MHVTRKHGSFKGMSFATLLVGVTCGLWLAAGRAGWAADEAGKSQEAKATDSSREMVSGKVQKVGEDSLTIGLEKDKTREIHTKSETRITLNGKQVQLGSLKSGDRVTVRMQPDAKDVAAMIRASRETGAAKEGEAKEGEKSTGEATRAALGLVIVQTPEGQVGVWRVAPRSPAAKAGLEHGDEIVRVDDETVNSPKKLLDLIAKKKPGDQVHITFTREGRERTVTVTLMERERLLSNARQERRAARHAEEGEEESGEARKPEAGGQAWLGLLLGEPEQEGVRVMRVLPDSPAAKAGVERGDILRQLGDEKIDSSEKAAEVLRTMKAGQKVPLHITRDDKEQTLEATLASREGREAGREGLRSRMERTGRGADAEPRLERRRAGEPMERIEGMLQDLKKDIQNLRDEVQELKKQGSEKK